MQRRHRNRDLRLLELLDSLEHSAGVSVKRNKPLRKGELRASALDTAVRTSRRRASAWTRVSSRRSPGIARTRPRAPNEMSGCVPEPQLDGALGLSQPTVKSLSGLPASPSSGTNTRWAPLKAVLLAAGWHPDARRVRRRARDSSSRWPSRPPADLAGEGVDEVAVNLHHHADAVVEHLGRARCRSGSRSRRHSRDRRVRSSRDTSTEPTATWVTTSAGVQARNAHLLLPDGDEVERHGCASARSEGSGRALVNAGVHVLDPSDPRSARRSPILGPNVWAGGAGPRPVSGRRLVQGRRHARGAGRSPGPADRGL